MFTAAVATSNEAVLHFSVLENQIICLKRRLFVVRVHQFGEWPAFVTNGFVLFFSTVKL